jgi:hypothetical protein
MRLTCAFGFWSVNVEGGNELMLSRMWGGGTTSLDMDRPGPRLGL